MPANRDDTSARLRHPDGDDADARARDQLHPDSRRGIDRSQIVNQLRQVLDAVNIMMRRRRNQRRPRRRMPNPSNVFRYFARRKLTAFARL